MPSAETIIAAFREASSSRERVEESSSQERRPEGQDQTSWASRRSSEPVPQDAEPSVGLSSSCRSKVQDTMAALREALSGPVRSKEESGGSGREPRSEEQESKPSLHEEEPSSSDPGVPFTVEDLNEDLSGPIRWVPGPPDDSGSSDAADSSNAELEGGVDPTPEAHAETGADPEGEAEAEEDTESDLEDEADDSPAPTDFETESGSQEQEEDQDVAEEENADRSAPGPLEPEDQSSGQSGDGMPPSETIELAEGGTGSPLGPVPSDSFFLWVTDHPRDEENTISVDHLGAERAREADAFLVGGTGKEPFRRLARIRGHSVSDIYLKPVFWVHAPEEESLVAEHVDGEWVRNDQSTLEDLEEKAAPINRRIEEIAGTGAKTEGGMELRVLRFMVTRDHQFTPRRTVDNSDGFVYPKLTPLLGGKADGRGGELLQVLSLLEDRRLLSSEFVMSQHACQNCGCGFLNFEEVCIHCGSTDLKTDDLVHHFRCGFTGALDEFDREQGKLVCPKCDRYLKQIGVDYDKPSVVHTCRRCREQFQDPDVQSTCYRCERTNAPEEQIRRKIKSFGVTALGEETAIYGLSDSLLSILERESRVLDYATFELVLESEAARIERYERSTSSLLLVQITGLQQLRSELGQRSQEVIEEMATAFDATLRSSDYLSARDESLYLFLLTETDEKGARRAGERLEENIEGVLSENLEHPPDLKISVAPVRPDLDLDTLANQFLESRPEEQVVNGSPGS